MLERLDDPDKITYTQRTLIPNFLDMAVSPTQPSPKSRGLLEVKEE
ncbi:hypothetical protein ACQ86K_05100 [Mucilaginibacter sp. P19]